MVRRPSYDLNYTNSSHAGRGADETFFKRWQLPRQAGMTRRRVVPYKTCSAKLGFYTNKGNDKVERLSQLFGSVVEGQGIQKTTLFGPQAEHVHDAIAQRSLFLPRSDVNLVPLGLPTHDINHIHNHNLIHVHNRSRSRSQRGFQASRAARRLCSTLLNSTALAHRTGLHCDADMVLVSRVRCSIARLFQNGATIVIWVLVLQNASRIQCIRFRRRFIYDWGFAGVSGPWRGLPKGVP